MLQFKIRKELKKETANNLAVSFFCREKLIVKHVFAELCYCII